MSELSRQARAKNEKVLQQHNKSVERQVVNLVGAPQALDLSLNIYCECSDIYCGERIEIAVMDMDTKALSEIRLREQHDFIGDGLCG